MSFVIIGLTAEFLIIRPIQLANSKKQTLVRAENGAYSFYVGKKRRYAFCLPLSEENERLFAEFIEPPSDVIAEDIS